MRSLVSALVLLAAATLAPSAGAGPAPDLGRARALDREGAKAYAEGRYRDALRAFDEAYALGGPAFELWNVAKCHLRLDEPERAAELLERYLATSGLPKGDRDQATRELEVLRKRSSPLTVTSTPAGAFVTIDGKPADATTPVTATVPAGPHTVVVSPRDSAPITREVEARYGRPLTVDVGSGAALGPVEPPANPYRGEPPGPRLAVRVGFGITLARLGEIGSTGPAFVLSGTWRVARARNVDLALGALLALASDGWENRTGAPDTATGCTNPVVGAWSGTSIAGHGVGAASFALASRLRFTATAGAGLAGYSVDNVGGDVFVASCAASPGVRPSFFVGTAFDWAIASSLRVSAFPLSWQIQPAEGGARATPRDATGPWMRFGLGLGVGVDL